MQVENIMLKDIDRILLSKEELDEAVKRLGRQISEDYRGETCCLSAFLGSVVSWQTLCVLYRYTLPIDFMCVSSTAAAPRPRALLEFSRI